MIVFDCETDNKANLILIGTMKNKKYIPFTKTNEFLNYIKQEKSNHVFAHNLEYDFFKVYEYEPGIKFSAFFNRTGQLSYVQMGKVFFKDTYNHIRMKLSEIGKLINIEKIEPDYEKITKLTPAVYEFNKNHCLITEKIIDKIQPIYRSENSGRIKATIGSQAMDIFIRNYFCSNFKHLPEYTIETWRKGYKGGYTEAFETGEFDNNTYYKIDCNSAYAFVMRTTLPYAYDYKVVEHLNDYDRKNKFWLGVIQEGNYGYIEDVINSIEHRNEPAHYFVKYYFVFKRCFYPFKRYVDHFYTKRKNAKDIFKKFIYKLLMNSLYGKFAQGNEIDVVTNYNYKKNIVYEHQLKNDCKRLLLKKPNKYWVNVVWSLFITAKVRHYMQRIKLYIESRGIKVYYTDTDSFIISGDITRISNIMSNKTLGLFKIEDMSNSIDIRGKKMYRFGDCYTCKGVPEQYRKDFFDNGEVHFKKMVRYKEALIRNLKLGEYIDYRKSNLMNK